MPPLKKPSYSRIHSTSDFDDTRTLNGDAGSDPGEKAWHDDDDDADDHHRLLGPSKRPSQHGSWRRRCSSPWLQGVLNVVLVFVVLGLLLERRTPAPITAATTTATSVTTEFEGSGDLTGFIPPVGQQIKTFVPNMSFVPDNGSEFFTRKVQKMWLSLVPRMCLWSTVENEKSLC